MLYFIGMSSSHEEKMGGKVGSDMEGKEGKDSNVWVAGGGMIPPRAGNLTSGASLPSTEILNTTTRHDK